MSKTMLFRLADPEKEPTNTLIDSDNTCILADSTRILDVIPVFNIILPFWTDSNVQLDTVFACIKNYDAILKKVEEAENKGKKYISSSLVNRNEELSIISLQPLKDMLVFYQKYHDVSKIEMKESDMPFLYEYMIEFVRRNDYSEKQGRFNSVFFYENLEVAVFSNKRLHKKSGSLCEVEIEETRNIEKYDGRWISDIRETCIFSEFLNASKSYWEGKMTDNPQIEYLFSGKYILKDIG